MNGKGRAKREAETEGPTQCNYFRQAGARQIIVDFKERGKGRCGGEG